MNYKIKCTASLVEAVAKDTNGDFSKLWDGSKLLEAIGESIVNWVDQGGEHYCARLDYCKSLFKNFNY